MAAPTHLEMTKVSARLVDEHRTRQEGGSSEASTPMNAPDPVALDRITSLGGEEAVRAVYPVFLALEALVEDAGITLTPLHPAGGAPLYLRVSSAVGTIGMMVFSNTTVGFLPTPTGAREVLTRIVPNQDAPAIAALATDLPRLVQGVQKSLGRVENTAE